MNKFQNLKPIKLHTIFDILKWKLFSNYGKKFWPDQTQVIDDRLVPEKRVNDSLHVTYVGHVTFLIQVNDFNILTDPIWSDRASPFSWIGPKRIKPPGIRIENLPPIDIILISHNHYDHLDIPTLVKLNSIWKPKIVVPIGNKKIIARHIKDANIVELNWHESFSAMLDSMPGTHIRNNHEAVNKSIDIYLEPAQHWSARSLWDKNKALWGTYIIDIKCSNNKGKQICFIGDSGYDANLFEQIGIRHTDIFLNLIPIGAYLPRELMKEVHMNPHDAVLASLDMGAQYSIGSHYDVFPLADDSYGQGLKDLRTALEELKVSEDRFFCLEVGQRKIFTDF